MGRLCDDLVTIACHTGVTADEDLQKMEEFDAEQEEEK